MCKWGETEALKLNDPKRIADVDKCIVPLVVALNNAGYRTIASCCGHGKMIGRISIEGYRDLLLVSYDEAQELCRVADDESMKGWNGDAIKPTARG